MDIPLFTRLHKKIVDKLSKKDLENIRDEKLDFNGERDVLAEWLIHGNKIKKDK